MEFTVKIDWVGDEESLDEALENRIVKAVSEKLVSKFSSANFEKVEKEALARLSEHVDELLAKLTERFMHKEVKVTDHWGDVKEKYESVEELLKSKFDAFVTQAVDTNGKPTNACSYGAKFTQVEYLIKKHIDASFVEAIKQVTADVERRLADKRKEITAQVVSKIVDKVEFKK